MRSRLLPWLCRRVLAPLREPAPEQRGLPRGAVLEELEPRVLYSADVALLALAAGGGSAATQAGSEPAAVTQQMQMQAQVQAQEHLQVQNHAGAASAEIAFVDMAVPDAATLVAGLRAQAQAGRDIEVVQIEAGQDGLAVIEGTLAGRQDIGALHLFGHGRSADLVLGSTHLDAQALAARAGTIARWGAALTEDADLLIYGCDVGAGAAGQAWTQALSALTGADVAASDDRTGAAALGGNWSLEVQVGEVRTEIAASSALQASYAGVLDVAVAPTAPATQLTSGAARGSSQAVALDGQGGYMVVWTDTGGQDGSGAGVYAQRFAFGTDVAVGARIAVNQTSAGNQQHASIVADADGTYTVVWQGQGADGSSDIYMRQFQADGTPRAAETRVNTTTAGEQTGAAVSVNRLTGDVIVAWQGAGPEDANGIFYRRFAADGSARDATDKLANGDMATGDAVLQSQPSVGMDTQGRFVIAWIDTSQIRFRVFTADGTGGAIRTTSASAATGPAIAMRDEGDFAIAYNRTDSSAGAAVSTFKADGTGINGVVFPGSGDGSVSATRTSDGAVLMVRGQAGSGMDIWRTVVDANGSVLDSGGTAVNQITAGNQYHSSIAAVDQNNYVVTWTSSVSGGTRVYARSVSTGVNTAPVIDTQAGLCVVKDTTRVAVLTASDGQAATQKLTWSIVGGADAARFTLDRQTSTLSFITPPRMAQPQDANRDNRYEVTVRVSDGMSFTDKTLSVRITAAAENAVLAADSYAVQTGASLLMDVTANDLGGEFAPLQIVSVTAGNHGTTAIEDNQIRYTPTGSVAQDDSFQYAVTAANALKNYWSLDGTLRDSVAGTLGSAGGTVKNVSTGAVNAAMNFDGNGWISVGNPALNAEFTISMWFRAPTDLDTNYARTMFQWGDGSADRVSATWMRDAGNNTVLRTVVRDSGGTATVDLTGRAALDGNWHQYVLTTRAGVGTTVQVDGVQVGQSAAAGGRAIAPNSGLTLGAKGAGTGNDGFIGDLDSFAIYHSPLYMTQQVSVRITAPAPAPVINSNAQVSIEENTTAVTTVTVETPGAGIVFSLAGGADQAKFDIESVSGVLTLKSPVDKESSPGPIQYQVTVRATDTINSVFSEQLLLVSIIGVNEAPTITSTGAAFTVAENTPAPVTLATFTAADPEGQPLRWSLLDGSPAAIEIDADSGALRLTTLLDRENLVGADAEGRYTLTVRVSDGVLYADRVITVQVLDDAGETDMVAVTDADPAPQAVTEGVAIGTRIGYTAATQERDATDVVRYSLTGTALFQIDAVSGVVTTAAELDRESLPGTLSFTVVATNQRTLASVSANVDVTLVDHNEFAVTAPVDSDSAPNTVQADAAIGSAVGVTAWAQDDDATQNTVTYALAAGGEAGGRFAIDAATGVVRTARELSADGGGSFDITIRATSGDGSSQTVTLTIAVTRVPVAAVNVTLPATPEDTPIEISRAQLLGENAGPRRIIDIVGLPSIQSGSGTLTAKADSSGWILTPAANWNGTLALAYELGDGSVTKASTATLAVQPVPDALVITSYGGAASVERSIAENTASVGQVSVSDVDGEALTWHLGGADQALFEFVDATGELRFRTAPNFEAAPGRSYAVTVEARSLTGRSALQAFTVAVTDVDEFDVTVPVDVDATADTVRADAAMDSTVGLALQASDADASNNTVSYALTDDAGGRFRIHAATGVVTTNADLMADRGTTQTIVVRATSSDGSFADASVSIAIARVPVTAVTASLGSISEDHSLSITRAQLLGSNLDDGRAVMVRKLSVGSGSGAVVDHGDGTWTFTPTADWNGAVVIAYEVTNGVDVAASSATLSVLAMPDAPLITSHGGAESAAVSVAEDTSAVAQFQATDADGDAITWTIAGGADASRFAIDATGALRFLTAPDKEALNAVGADGRYEVIVRASDGQLHDSRTILVSIRDVNEFAVTPPADVDADSNRVLADAPIGSLVGITARASDADATNNAVRYALASNPGERFEIDAQTGVLRTRTELSGDGGSAFEIVVRATSADGSTSELRTRIDIARVPIQAVAPKLPSASAGGPVHITQDQLLDANAGERRIAEVVAPSIDPATGALAADPAGGGWVYTPAPGFSGSVVITYTVSDGQQSQLSHATLVVLPAAPTAMPGPFASAGTAVPKAPDPLAGAETSSAGKDDAPSSASYAATAGAAPAADAQTAALIPASDTSAAAALIPAATGGPAHATAIAWTPGSDAGTERRAAAASTRLSPAARVAPIDPMVLREAVTGLAWSDQAVGNFTPMPMATGNAYALADSLRGPAIAEALSQLHEDMAGRISLERIELASAAAVSGGLSFGYVLWLTRGGVLLASMMSSVPAWAGLDPLPVLSTIGGAGGSLAGDLPDLGPPGGGDGDGSGGSGDDRLPTGSDDALERLFQRAGQANLAPPSQAAASTRAVPIAPTV